MRIPYAIISDVVRSATIGAKRSSTMKTLLKAFLYSSFLTLSLSTPLSAYADKCDVDCPKGSSAIECEEGCGCWCDAEGKATCSCSNQKSCDVDCKQGSKSITCSGGGCGCYCDADGKPTCECTKGGHKK